MNLTDKDILLKLLDAINYTGDREAFVNQFLGLVQAQAFDDLMQSIPQEQKQAAYEDAAKRLMVDWIGTIDNTLEDQQKDKLVALSQEFSSAAAQ